jgi:preprotein translocase subunit YajC
MIQVLQLLFFITILSLTNVLSFQLIRPSAARRKQISAVFGSLTGGNVLEPT